MDEQLYQTIELSRSTPVYTNTENTEEGRYDSYLVHSGRVRVYVVWTKDSSNGRPIFLCEIPAGVSIPGFSALDTDENGDPVHWCFLLQTDDRADLRIMRGLGTSVTQRKFVKAVDELSAADGGAGKEFVKAYEKEGRSFSRAVREFYANELKKDAIRVYKDNKSEKSDKEKTRDTMKGVLEEENKVRGKDPTYRAIRYACEKSGISIKEEDEIIAACGETFTVPELAEASQFACRRVVLDKDWYRKDCGIIAGKMDGIPVTCVPKGSERYTICNGETGEICDLTKEIAEKIDPRAYVLTRTLPCRPLTKKDLFLFGLKSIRRQDLIVVAVLALVAALIGILIPTLNQKIYDEYIPLGNESQLVQICVVIASFMLGNLFFGIVKNLSNSRISSHISIDLQNAVYYRVFQLPESFFRNYDSADLAQRLGYISVFADTVTNTLIVSGMSVISGLLFLYKMIRYSGKLTVYALLMIAVYAVFQTVISTLIMRFQKEAEKNRGEASSRLYQFLNGIEKIRLSGAEEKAANEYLTPYVALQNIELKSDRLGALEGMISGAVTTLFSMVFYTIIVKSGLKISTGAFMAFNSAFGSFSGILLALIGNLLDIYQLRPLYERFRPIVETAPEDDGKGKIAPKISGAVSVKDVIFSYDGSRNVLNGINMEIKPGEYIGIVGASGCGKSTLLKLLLGFETPAEGSITYDQDDLRSLDKRSFRKNIGVVLQNGKLISGTILENITITAPNASMKEVNRVIDAVGLRKDIERMPMGIRTMLGENAGTISGGQAQRILIARAIISDPSILIFDEATSALDNRTQAEVCKNLEKMNITRIAVAHRLSTIRNCDRIYVMDKGTVVQSGDYESLMIDQKGLFYQLASRQLSGKESEE